VSVVTNILLMTGFLDETQPVANINSALACISAGSLKELSSDVGGPKALESNLLAAAFNHLDIGNFISIVQCQPWENPENVQLLIQLQHEDRFTMYMFEGDHLIPVETK